MEFFGYGCFLRRVLYLTVFTWMLLVFSGGSVYSDLTFVEAISGVDDECPEWILNNQVLIDVVYFGFDEKIHRGQVVADARVAGDLQKVFMLMLITGFPLESVIPISELGWDDFQSMELNNTSAFNYRTVPFSSNLSNHAYGLAIDINPLQNPYYTGTQVFPENAEYDPFAPGTLYEGHLVVRLFRHLGWRWGGDWREKDYQHFDKQLEETALENIDKHFTWPPWR